MRLPVLTAAGGAAWEERLVVGLARGQFGVAVVRRCLDVVDLLAVAASGQARAALVSATLRHLDADAVDRLAASDVVVVGVVGGEDAQTEARIQAMGIRHVVPDDADAVLVAAVIEQAVAGGMSADRGRRGYALPSTTRTSVAPPVAGTERIEPARGRGSIIAVWGPTGAPGRTTVGVLIADELARRGSSVLLVDADVYGGVVASVLGLLDESPGLAAACRHAASGRLTEQALAELCWQLTPTLRVLTGIPRPDRWPELRPSAVEAVLGAARRLADVTVVDCGFNLETDEELSFDTLAPRRNGATLAVLDAADVIVAVGSADPVGLQRLVRGLADLRAAEVTAQVRVVLNKVRRTVVPGDVTRELPAALERFAGRTPAALLPFDQEGLDAALAAGRTLAEIRPGCSLRLAGIDLAEALAGGRSSKRRRRDSRSAHAKR
jgi:MinD-like ATPase involved in chromosome partitioning or flagellar assembly